MTTETTPMQEVVDGQLAELQITSAEVTGDTYKERHTAKIAALAEEEAALPTPTDKASLQAVQDFITKSEKARTGIDKFRKSFKERWKPMLDAVDAYLGTTKENGRQAEIYVIQQRAEAKKKAYLDEQAKAQREAEALLETRYQGRLAKLMEGGMSIEANGNLTIRDGEQVLTALPNDIRFASDEKMAAVLSKVAMIRQGQIEREEAERQAKEAEERERQEEAARLKAQKEEQDAAAAKLKEEREELDREKAEMRKAKNAARWEELRTLGAEAGSDGDGKGMWIGPDEPGGGRCRVDTLADLSDEGWGLLRDRVREAKVKAIEEQQRRDREWKLYVEREHQLIDLGVPYDGDAIWALGKVTTSDREIAVMTSDEWEAVLAKFTAKAIQIKAAEIFVKEGNEAIARSPLVIRGTEEEMPGEPGEGLQLNDDMPPVAHVDPIVEGSAVVGDRPIPENGVAGMPVDEFSGEPLTLESAVFQALGEASLCWDPRPTGIFDSTRAKDVGDRLVATLKSIQETV